MANNVIYTRYFLNRAKNFKRKHPSLDSDLEVSENSLVENPHQGNDLGGGLHKIRLAVKSKGKGKSGGYRVITYLITEVNDDLSIIMLTLYDKSEESGIDKKRLFAMIEEIK